MYKLCFLFYFKENHIDFACLHMAPWSRGKDSSFSRWHREFDSPRGHHDGIVQVGRTWGSITSIVVGSSPTVVVKFGEIARLSSLCSSSVEVTPLPSKQISWVQFPSAAPRCVCNIIHMFGSFLILAVIPSAQKGHYGYNITTVKISKLDSSQPSSRHKWCLYKIRYRLCTCGDSGNRRI